MLRFLAASLIAGGIALAADTSATLDLNGFTRLRWRVYAVPRFGPGGKESTWREIEGTPVTKIYK